MNNNFSTYHPFFRKAAKAVLYIGMYILLLFAVLAITVQVPFVQTAIVNTLARKLSEMMDYPVKVDHVNLRWYDSLELEGVSIRDPWGVEMIGAGKIHADFKLSSLFKHHIRLDYARAENAAVRLVIDKKTDLLNINYFIDKIDSLLAKGDTSRTKDPASFGIDKIQLKNVVFNLNDQRNDSIRDGFDYYHINFADIFAEISNFRVRSDTVELNIDGIRAYETGCKWPVHNITAFFRSTQKNMAITQIEGRVGKSVVGDSVVFHYDKPSDMTEFNTMVKMRAKLNKAVVDFEDLARFAPSLRAYKERATLSGQFKGKVVDFDFNNFRLDFGKRSYFAGNLSAKGLPEFFETFSDLRLKESFVDMNDVRQYIDHEEAFAVVRKFGDVNLNGKFNGFPLDFVANGSFQTALGDVVSDVRLVIEENEAKSSYSGNLATFGFDIGKLADRQELLQLMDMKGQIKGKGFSLSSAAFKLVADVQRLGINHYDYRNIRTDATLEKSLFDGKLSVRDTNLLLDLNGIVDMHKGANIVNLTANMPRAHLNKLHIADNVSMLRADMDLNFKGLKADEVSGEAFFTNLFIAHKERELELDSLFVSTSKDDGQRSFQLVSDLVKATAHGNFEFSQLIRDVPKLVKEYGLIFNSNEPRTAQYYKQKNANAVEKYDIGFDVQLKNINPFIWLFVPDLYIAKQTHIIGQLASDNTTTVSVNAKADTVIYDHNYFYQNEVDASASKVAGSPDVLASVYVFSRNQFIQAIAPTQNMVFDGIWNNKQINFTSFIAQVNSTNRANLNGQIDFLPDRLQMRLTPASFKLIEKDWIIAPDNLITFNNNGSIGVQNLRIVNHEQSITVEGVMSKYVTDSLQVNVHNFQLASLNTVLEQQLGGKVDSEINFKALFGKPGIRGDFSIATLSVDKFLVGDVGSELVWDYDNNRLGIVANVDREKAKVLTVKGFYSPDAPDNTLDLQADMNSTSLSLLEPFLKEWATNWGGFASGNMSIGGTLTHPELNGSLQVNEGTFRINYLNTVYRFSDRVYFTKNEIVANNVTLYDVNGNTGYLKRGILWHDGFSNFNVTLLGNLDNFQVLNTGYKDNELYYGNAIVTGKLEINGPLSDIRITADVKSDKGTRIFIPIADDEDLNTQQDFISFRKNVVADTVKKESVLEKVNLSGFSLDFNMDVTPDAYVEIIFDRKSGDVIRGNGTGRIKMAMDTRGDFTMFGQYTITKGAYNFTLKNIANKEFKIKAGSTITWNGNPLGGLLNIAATYNLNASLAPLVASLNPNADLTSPRLNRRYPTAVTMNLIGNLLTPQITLGIDITEYPRDSDLGSAVTGFQARILADEQELNRQVFSLLVFRGFMREGSLDGSFVRGGVSSISELVTNQLSSLLSKVDPNLEVNFNIAGLDQNAPNALQLGITYTAFEGRLRVSRQGSFTNVQNQATTASVAGDWTVEYMLSNDGVFRAKMFYRNNQNTILALNNQTPISTGFSVLHTQSFDKVHELLPRWLRKKKKEENAAPDLLPAPKDEEENNQPKPLSTVPADTLRLP